jgi:single cache domain-containing protein
MIELNQIENDRGERRGNISPLSALWRFVMLRNIAFVVGYTVILVLSTAASIAAADFGTAEEAKAMLERAVAAVKEDKAKALDMFNNGAGAFKDRDLYVWCANASDGIVTAQPYMNRGKQLRDIKGKRGAPFGETIMQNATEGTIKETTYWWPRPGEDEPLEKETFYTKVGDQICGVGYYKK